MSEKAPSSKPNRRQFLATSGAVIAGAASASRWTAASSRRVPGANDRVRIGVIGCGGMGTGHVHHLVGDDRELANLTNSDVTAVAEIYKPRLERAVGMCDGKGFHDYRELIASDLVDAVIIAAPEHWHYRMALDATQAGLDVYLQKAMTRTFEEARSLYHEVRRAERVFQVGSQYMQAPSWKRAKQLYEKGQLGKVTFCQTSYCRNSREGEWNYEIDEGVEPGKNLDWKAYLGPLPHMDYDPEYYFRWRKYRAFSAGVITDLMPHKIHCLHYVLGARYPTRVTAVGGTYVHPDREVADMNLICIEYGDYTMLFAGSTCNEVGLEDLIRGHQGNLYIGSNSVRLTPERTYADDFDPIEEKLEPAQMGNHQMHLKEWIEAIRSRKQPTWSIEPAFQVMTAIAMAEQAYFGKRAVEFDEEKLEIL